MFTGLIEETGSLERFERRGRSARLSLRAPLLAAGIAVGDSLALNGCCLTLAAREGDLLEFDLLEETLSRTNLGDLEPGQRVNLERALAAGARLGGHFVQGHVDTTAPVIDFSARGQDHRLEVQLPHGQGRYTIMKGSIALNGVSLTIAELTDSSLVVWLIPHTLAMTNLGDLRPGQAVNIEFDLLGKYVERMFGHEGM